MECAAAPRAASNLLRLNVLKTFRALLLLLIATAASGEITLLVEEPYGDFGGLNPTGHAAVYFSRVCAESPAFLRLCKPGEQGAVISRYHRVGGYDWLAIPLTPYLYAVDRANRTPASVTPVQAGRLRDEYRRRHLESLAPDEEDGTTPSGEWTQLVGEAYDRKIHAYTIQTTEEQDRAFIHWLNGAPNRNRFNLLFQNCADFVRHVIDFYYPRAVHRSLVADLGIMTPKQAAKCLERYSRKHPELEFSATVNEQVPGTVPRSSPVRGVLESLLTSKKYSGPIAVLLDARP